VRYALVVIAVCACDTAERADADCEPIVAAPIDARGEVHRFVVDTIRIPASFTEALQLGRDIDRDPQGRPDNQLGMILSVIRTHLDTDLNAETAALIDAGKLLHLLEVRATSLGDAAHVGALLFHGVDTDGDPADNFSGDETFGIDGSRGIGLTSGAIADGVLDLTSGTFPIAVTFPGLGEPFVIELVAGWIDGDITADGLSGRLGGAVTVDELDRALIPALVEGLNRIIARDCPDGTCESGSGGELLVDYFDDCGEGSSTCDGLLSVDELRSNDLVSSLLAPDMDLFDEAGQLNPRCDQVKDALSIGLGFTAVPARF
jgi:hypothetical protein